MRAEDDSISLHPPPEGHACRKIRVPPRFDRKGVPMVEVSHIATIWQMLNNLRAPTPHIRIGAGSPADGTRRCCWPGRTCGLHVVTSLSYWFRNCSQGSAVLRGKRRKVRRGQHRLGLRSCLEHSCAEAHKPLIPRSEGSDNEANEPAKPHRRLGQGCSWSHWCGVRC